MSTFLVSDADGTRNATVDETAIINAIQSDCKNEKQAVIAAAAARASALTKLAGLGLTADEIAALLGA